MTAKKSKTEFATTDIGKWFTTDGTDIWTLKEFIPEPMVTMVRLDKEQVKAGMVSEFKDFVRLAPEADPPARTKRKYEKKQAWPDTPEGEGVKNG